MLHYVTTPPHAKDLAAQVCAEGGRILTCLS